MMDSMRKASAKAPMPVILLIAAFLCPTEFSLYLEGLRLPPHRVALLILLPIALVRLLAGKHLRFRSYDAALILFNIWTVGIFMYHHGDHDGLVYGGSLALESLGSYLVARTWVRNREQFEGTLRAMAYAITIAALIALPETLLGQTFTHDILKSLTGYVHPTAVETRLHLTRAYGTFDHPIHYGTFCAAFLALFWFAAKSPQTRRRNAALLVVATFLGLSSAPILCLGLQAAMLVWERLTRGVASRTAITMAILGGLYIGASVVMTRSPINLIATGMTLDSWTGYYRLQIWENGLNNVYGNPWTGIGLNDWVRPWWMVSSTIDAFWLVIGMREGIPAVLLIMTGLALLVQAVRKNGLRNSDIAVRRLSRGWIMSLIALSLVACTVHFWNVLHAFFFFFIGIAGFIADPARVMMKSKIARAADRMRLPHRKSRASSPPNAYPGSLTTPGFATVRHG